MRLVAMGRGRRIGGGAGGGGGENTRSNFDRILRRHIKSAPKENHSTVERLVEYLRITYPHYSRHKLQPFTRRVHQVVQLDEAQHKRKRDGGDVHNSSAAAASSTVASTSSSGGDSSDGEGSNSEDAIYGEKFEPEFDLMKSMLRENLKKNSKVKEAVELDVVYNDDAKKVEMVTEEGHLDSHLSKAIKTGHGNSGGGENKGPMFQDFGGMKDVIDQLIESVLVPLCHPQLPLHLGVKPVAGVLLHGPPGCGKTMLARAIANELEAPFYEISATELVSGVSGASEKNIRELFAKAYKTTPSIVFIDEIDAIASKRDNSQREMEKRIVAQLLKSMDRSNRPHKPVEDNATSEGFDCGSGHVLVIGATNRPDAIDPGLRRPGRFDHEIALGIPDECARVEILSVLTRNMRLEGAFDFLKIARATSGFVGADLAELANRAGSLAMNKIIKKRMVDLSDMTIDKKWWKQPWSREEMEGLTITMADFEEAAKMVQPSLKREGFSTVPNVKWEDVGGLHFLRHEFERYIVKCIKLPEISKELGVDLDSGILLYGPPGCGKTLIAKAVANEAGANFIYIKAAELMNKYVGESEAAVRALFNRARACAPCIVFFDEVDALMTQRGHEGAWVVERVVNQVLSELDGAAERHGVYVIGATNRPDVMDDALFRPGRFDRRIYVPLPSPDDRGLILKALARKKPIDASVDLIALGRDVACENFSGADLKNLMKEAALAARDDESVSSSETRTIKEVHLKIALGRISRSVSDKQVRNYEHMKERFEKMFG
ncbi:cell division control protein 48 homolog C-like [Andrographis paniculata]|uniref:cell division control protein 48 homolog C-like n=1 Tax=Andrographis paniculata TaxID=175694 RepID=UPI0021E78DC0|nr:cell division control protein 48 homolog C-like [Andrographis paniculata]